MLDLFPHPLVLCGMLYRMVYASGKRSAATRRAAVAGVFLAWMLSWAACAFGADVLVEAEGFASRGGWDLDPQFMDLMGSPYLLAHGLGKPVANAKTQVAFPETGTYRVWVRTRDWVPSHHPGRFKVIVDGTELAGTFGTQGEGWIWQDGGTVQIQGKQAAIELKDLTGFDGRCDALFFTTDPASVPPGKPDAQMAAWRRKRLGLPETPPSAGTFDLVVIGGGIAGCCAALTAARLGLEVAVVQDRPVLGGNASSEIQISPYGPGRPPVDEVCREIARPRPFASEKNLKLFLGWHAYGVQKQDNRIASVEARNTGTNKELRFEAPVFIDSTGDGWIGFWAGAEFRMGREGYEESHEALAPNKPDNRHHGCTVRFSVQFSRKPPVFPDVPWATEVSKDYLDVINGPVHFWEFGQTLDTTQDLEEIRDHLFRAIYGAFATFSARNANFELAWVGHIAARGESRRLLGEYLLTENDIESCRVFPDTVATCLQDFFCLHYTNPRYEFRTGGPRPAWETEGRARGPAPGPTSRASEPPPRIAGSIPAGKCGTIPFRCLYSRNIVNLMMAGRCVSATHVAYSSIKVMRIGGQMGVATGAAAFLCKKHRTAPRAVGQDHIEELQDIVFARSRYQNALQPSPALR